MWHRGLFHTNNAHANIVFHGMPMDRANMLSPLAPDAIVEQITTAPFRFRGSTKAATKSNLCAPCQEEVRCIVTSAVADLLLCFQKEPGGNADDTVPPRPCPLDHVVLCNTTAWEEALQSVRAASRDKCCKWRKGTDHGHVAGQGKLVAHPLWSSSRTLPSKMARLAPPNPPPVPPLQPPPLPLQPPALQPPPSRPLLQCCYSVVPPGGWLAWPPALAPRGGGGGGGVVAGEHAGQDKQKCSFLPVCVTVATT